MQRDKRLQEFFVLVAINLGKVTIEFLKIPPTGQQLLRASTQMSDKCGTLTQITVTKIPQSHAMPVIDLKTIVLIEKTSEDANILCVVTTLDEPARPRRVI